MLVHAQTDDFTCWAKFLSCESGKMAANVSGLVRSKLGSRNTPETLELILEDVRCHFSLNNVDKDHLSTVVVVITWSGWTWRLPSGVANLQAAALPDCAAVADVGAVGNDEVCVGTCDRRT